MVKFLSVLLLMAGVLLSSMGADLSYFRFVRSAEREDAHGTHGVRKEWYDVEFDAPLYAVIDDLSGDLRLSGGDDEGEVPFAVARRQGRDIVEKLELLPGKIVGIKSLPDLRTCVEFELENTAYGIAALELVTAEKGYDKLLSVQIGDGRNWRTALTAAPFRDYSAVLDSTAQRFNLPGRFEGRTVRVVFDAPPGGDRARGVKLDAMRVYKATAYELDDVPLLTPYALEVLENKVENDQSVVVFGSHREPLSRLTMVADSPLYVRNVTWYGSDDRNKWSRIAGGVIRKIGNDIVDTLEFPESRFRYYRLKIANGDAPALTGLRFAAQGVAYYAAVPAHYAAGRLKLYYGGKAEHPEYALTDALKKSSAAGHGRYLLREPGANTALAPELRQTDRRRWIFSLGVIGLAALAALWLFRNLAKNHRLLPEN